MRDPCDAASGLLALPDEELRGEPEAEHNYGRHSNSSQDEYQIRNRYDYMHLGSRKKNEVRTEQARDGTTCSNRGNHGICIGKDVSEAGEQPGYQVKNDETNLSQDVFDVVAEDPKKEHVARDVKDASMKKHRGNEGDINGLLQERDALADGSGQRFAGGDLLRDNAPLEEELA